MPAVGKILIVFFGMLALTRIKVPLGIALLLGGIALNLWAGVAAAETSAYLKDSVLSLDVWLMVIITTMVVEFGRFMTEKDNADEMLGAIKRWGGRHGRTWSLMAVPAVVGLIPMPAGALFSAPLVGQASEHTRRSSEWKATINYWFRHIWEYWWPLYPGVVVAISVFGMENWRFFITQAPFTLVAVGSGYAFLVHRHLHELTADTDTSRPPGRRLLFIMLPLAIVIVGVLLFPYVLKPLASELNEQDIRLVAMLVSLVMGMFTILYDEKKRTGKIKVFSSLLKPKSLGILLTIFGVMVFKHMLEFSGMVGVASDELQAANINLVYVVAALPFLAGLITGVAVGFTGASFPFVVGLLNAAGSGLHPMSTLALAYGFGYMGMMLSPVHLCLLVTRDYFDSSIYGVYRHVAPCALTILAFSVLAHMLFAFLGV